MSNFAIINVSISQSFCVKLKAAIFQTFNNYHGKKDKSTKIEIGRGLWRIYQHFLVSGSFTWWILNYRLYWI